MLHTTTGYTFEHFIEMDDFLGKIKCSKPGSKRSDYPFYFSFVVSFTVIFIVPFYKGK